MNKIKKCDFCKDPIYTYKYIILNNKFHSSCEDCSKKFEQNIVKEVRLLPMSKNLFKTKESFRNFLEKIMPKREYTYYFITNKFRNESGNLIFFQYDNKIWGHALHISTTKKEFVDNNGVKYKGYYKFAPDTLCIFNKPITKEELATINKKFEKFNQSAQKIPIELMPKIIKLLKEKISPEVEISIPEEIAESNLNLREGVKKQIIVNAYERNRKARAACINYYKNKNGGKIFCQICGFDFGKVYGKEFSEKINIHHIIELSTISKEYEVNPIKDLIPICPNCHLIIHSKKPAYTPQEIKKMIKKLEK